MKESNAIHIYDGFITDIDKLPVIMINNISVLDYLSITSIVSIVKRKITLGTIVYTPRLFGDAIERTVPTDDTITVYVVNLSNGRTIYLDKNPLGKPKKKVNKPTKKAKEEQSNG